jgi:hypothetical protein
MQGSLPAPAASLLLVALTAALFAAAFAMPAWAAGTGGAPEPEPAALSAQTAPYAETLPPYLSPFPAVRVKGRLTLTGVRISSFRILAPPGSRVRVVCIGGRRLGCPYRARRFAQRRRALTIGSLQRNLQGGVRLKVYVRRGRTIGKYAGYRIRVLRLPVRTDACLFPGTKRPQRCP